ncbi:hypothetical protein [Haloarchaeobius litoreus]|uniref:Right handed beta helix region n=1 Tax=Haloarchaeobius litoreus TaxID=755306 RepID=A0ABD6DRC6_9EURY|nr:hypothetical protein [Haloarchaeobius litoreus]
MEDVPGIVTLTDGDWTGAFRRLAEQQGGIIWVPPGTHDCEPTTVDLADYGSLGDNVAIRGAGLGTSVLDLGSGAGDGFSLVDSEGGDLFYIDISGVRFQGAREGVLFRLGTDECTDAYNSCRLSFATNNGSSDGTAACRLNHVLNTRHFGVHNCVGGTALELRQFQFGGITGSVSSRQGLSMDFRGYSMANVVEWLNVEACADGVRIVGENSGINRFGMLYGANVHGTLWRHEAPVETRIDAAFLGSNIETVGRTTAGSVSVGITNASASAFEGE